MLDTNHTHELQFDLFDFDCTTTPTRTCNECRETKPLDESNFYRRTDKRLERICRKCVIAKKAAYNVRACWSLDNLQPLWAKDNLAKSARAPCELNINYIEKLMINAPEAIEYLERFRY